MSQGKQELCSWGMQCAGYELFTQVLVEASCLAPEILRWSEFAIPAAVAREPLANHGQIQMRSYSFRVR